MSFCFRFMTGLTWLLLLARGSAADLVFGMFALPSRAFTQVEASTFPESGQADAAAVLKKRGFDMSEGSSAFFDAAKGMIFLRSTARDVRRLERLSADLPESATEREPRQVQVSATCYAVPLSAVPPAFGPRSGIGVLPAGQLTVVDRSSLICRDGQRSQTKTTQDSSSRLPAGQGAESETLPPLSRDFEMECTLGNTEMIDLNMAWEIRTPLLAPAGQAAEFKVSTQIMARTGGNVTMELGTTTEKEPRLVFLVLQTLLLPDARALRESGQSSPVPDK